MDVMKPSPLAPAGFPDIPPVAGVSFATRASGIRYKDRDDLLLATFAPETTAAGVLTQSRTAAAPVLWCRKALRTGSARALLMNAGNANAFTGKQGEAAVVDTVHAVANRLSCAPGEVFVASTGTIGVQLPVDKILAAMPHLVEGLRPTGWDAAARAIMTTDTFPKGAFRTCMVGDTPVTVAGVAKGSGMIAPAMGTMLAFVVTDARIPAKILQKILNRGVKRSFNAITVDGDTSTSDTLLAFATGQAKHAPIVKAKAPELDGFRVAFEDVLLDLALQVVKDGEGASKLMEITVSGAEDSHAARRIGLAIGNSPLVKTAVAGEDANWGRIVMAVGKAGEAADPDRMVISIGGVPITAGGAVRPDYDEAPVAAHMKGQHVLIHVDVGVGRGEATVWSCDLTHGYIDINGSYRT